MAAKILIVEDNKDCTQILVFILSPLGYNVLEASSGEEAVLKAVTERPDLIIMDLGLPDMNGLEATTRIKQNPDTAHIPVIAYTAWGEEFKEKAMKIGITEFLQKPSPPKVIQEIVGKFLTNAA